MKAYLMKFLLYGGPGLAVIIAFFMLNSLLGPVPPSTEEIEQAVAERSFMEKVDLAAAGLDNASDTADNASAVDEAALLPTNWEYYSFIEVLTSNLADTKAYLKLEVTLASKLNALAAEKFINEMNDLTPAMRSAILLYLGGVSGDAVKNSAGREALADELRGVINGALEQFKADSRVDMVYFTDFAVING